MTKWGLTSVLFSVCLVALVTCTGCAPKPSEEEIAKRVREAHPAWESYQEDIKGMIGAAPVAEWHGQLAGATHSGSKVEVTFKLEGAWAGLKCAMPILLREPAGQVLNATPEFRSGSEVAYLFDLPETNVPLAWVELKFPRGERRLVFSEEGAWRPKPE